MAAGNARLQLMRDAEPGPPASIAPHGDDAARALTTIEAGPELGRLAHPATAPRRTEDLRSRRQVESEVVGFVADLLAAPLSAVGTVTTGVEEAAWIVVAGARDARAAVRRPTMVVSEAAHPAYVAAARSLGVVPLVVPVDSDGRAPVGLTCAAITDDTVLVVASAPSYTHGLVDPVAWVAAATMTRDLPLHVDASCGGWAMAYADLAGHVGPAWGFAVPGVSSVAIDAGPDRGTRAEVGVLLHRNAGERRRLVSTAYDGPGAGDLATWQAPGRALADTAETLREIGHEGCAELAARERDATARIVEGLVDQRGVSVVGRPDASSITLRCDATCDPFTLADELRVRGWAAEPVLANRRRQALLRLPVTASVAAVVPGLLEAVREAVAAAQAVGRRTVDPTLETMLLALDPEDVTDYAARLLVEAADVLDAAEPVQLVGTAPGAGTRRAAAYHLLLDAADPRVRVALLAARFEQLTAPVRRGTPDLAQVAASASTSASE